MVHATGLHWFGIFAGIDWKKARKQIPVTDRFSTIFWAERIKHAWNWTTYVQSKFLGEAWRDWSEVFRVELFLITLLLECLTSLSHDNTVNREGGCCHATGGSAAISCPFFWLRQQICSFQGATFTSMGLHSPFQTLNLDQRRGLSHWGWCSYAALMLQEQMGAVAEWDITVASFWNLFVISTAGAGIIERKLKRTKVRLFTVPCCSIILFSSEGVKKKCIWSSSYFFASFYNSCRSAAVL